MSSLHFMKFCTYARTEDLNLPVNESTRSKSSSSGTTDRYCGLHVGWVVQGGVHKLCILSSPSHSRLFETSKPMHPAWANKLFLVKG